MDLVALGIQLVDVLLRDDDDAAVGATAAVDLRDLVREENLRVPVGREQRLQYA